MPPVIHRIEFGLYYAIPMPPFASSPRLRFELICRHGCCNFAENPGNLLRSDVQTHAAARPIPALAVMGGNAALSESLK